jgi:hypothetical protein
LIPAGAPIDILASDRQEGLPVHYKTPFSIAAGLEYKVSDETLIHFAVEWFAPISTYAVMQPESGNFILNNPAIVRPRDSAELLKVYDSMKSILNAGIAVEHKMNDNITGYAAIRTDFSNAIMRTLKVCLLDLQIFNVSFYCASTNIDDTMIGVS